MRRFFSVLLIALIALAGCREDKKKKPVNNNNNNTNNTNNNTGDTIFMVQDPSHSHFINDGETVNLQRKIVTAVDKYGSRTGSFWISESNVGPYSGVQVFNTDTQSAWWTDLKVGDLVNVYGTKMEYSYRDPDTNEDLFEDPLTEIVDATVQVLGSGTPLSPVDIDAADLNSVATGEQWEGVLVRLNNVRVTRVRDRGSRYEVYLYGSTKAQDDLMDVSLINEGACLSRLTGVVTYFFDYYVMPRSAADIEFAANDSDCPEVGPEICDDGIDNNGSGFIDCDDFECIGDPACPPKVENTNALCSDGIDNDGDGLVDCQDPSCYGHPDVTVCTETICDDNIDNDGDGYTDCEDWDCKMAPNCAEFYEQICDDGIDNDNDGYTDCADFDCRDHAVCKETICDDGIDNNGNGHIDCADWDCLYTDPICWENAEITDEECSDGISNNGNQYIDCQDFSCQRSPLVTVCEGNPRTCSDGIDNDGNGYIDCADFACRYCHATDPSKDRVVSTCPPCVR